MDPTPDSPPAEFEQLFEQAIDLPEGERAAFLASLDIDADMRERLRQALRQFAQVEQIGSLIGSKLARVLDLTGGRAELAAPEERSHIGPYKILRLLGEGGMGTVYLVERADDSVRQQVALKLIHTRSRVMHARERFEQERRILANLKHPGIAAMFDWGRTERDEPYYTMEYVDGLPILAYCREHLHTIEGRVRLLIKVAGCLAYAHQNLVVHRDIKTSNILVNLQGDVRLLDFGIAKLLDDTLNPSMTGTEVAPMTLEAVSPEQVHKEAITVATDIYQFGVLCFRVLTGQSPYVADPSNTLEWLKAVTETEPLTLDAALKREGLEAAWSSEASIARVRRQASRDLDAILRMAMAKTPAARYRTMDAMTDDLQRFLESRPVRARRTTAIYRTLRFLRRHAVASAVTLTVILIITFAVLRIRVERDHAIAAEITQRHLADAGTDITHLVSQVLARSRTDPHSNAIDANRFFDTLTERLHGEALASPEERGMLLSLAAGMLVDANRWKEALPLYQEQLTIRRAALPAAPLQVVQVLTSVAATAAEVGDSKLAEESLSEARLLFEQQPSEPTLDRFNAVRQLGSIAFVLGHHREAQAYLAKALELCRSLYGTASREYARALWDEARGMARWRRANSALPLYEQALDTMTRSYGSQHLLLWRTRVELGLVLVETGDAQRAQTLCSAAATESMKQGGAHQFEPYAKECLSRVHELSGNLDEAIEAEMQSSSLIRQMEGEKTPWLPHTLARLGYLQTQHEDMAAAEPLLREALAMQEKLENTNNEAQADTRLYLAMLLMEMGRYDEAEPLIDSSRATYGASLGPDSDEVATTFAMQAVLDAHKEKLDSAQKALLQAESLFSDGKSILHTERQRLIHNAYADIAEKQGQFALATQHRKQAIVDLEAFYGPTHFRVAKAKLLLAQSLAKGGSADEARAVASSIVPVLEANLSPQSPSRRQAQVLIDAAAANSRSQ